MRCKGDGISRWWLLRLIGSQPSYARKSCGRTAEKGGVPCVVEDYPHAHELMEYATMNAEPPLWCTRTTRPIPVRTALRRLAMVKLRRPGCGSNERRPAADFQTAANSVQETVSARSGPPHRCAFTESRCTSEAIARTAALERSSP